MDNKSFYDLLDQEIKKIVDENKENALFQVKQEESKKSFGFLLWFLKNSLNKGNKYDQYSQYIVDGNDDNSCDMIFFNTENGEKVYYVVQAKWFSKGKINKSNDITNIYKACLTDFYMILDHKKKESSTNTKFNKMYRELKRHTENNGKVRFILVTLCVTNPDVRLQELHEYRNTPLVTTEIHDLITLKNMYIDHTFRGYVTHNPLEETDSVNQLIDINILKPGYLKNCDSTYIFLLGASEISRLYKKFGDRLFLKNIRNPLKVEANIAIQESAQKDPKHFLGYNNGITIITKGVKDFYDTNSRITINGLQVINGAQTFKSIANAYDEANRSKRKMMKDNLAIVMKVIAVDDPEIERNIIKYTNTQTRIIPRDYHSNDLIQERIYYDLLRNTDIVYQRKRGEFSDDARKKLNIVSNEDMAQCYLAYGLQNPYLARTGKKQLFDEDNGVYKDIFTPNLDYRVLYTSYVVFKYVSNKIDSLKKNEIETKKYDLLKYSKYYIAALMRHTFRDYNTYFNQEYLKTVEKGKKVDKNSMADALLFNMLNDNNVDPLEDAYNKAVDYLISFTQDQKDAGNFYKRGDSYKRMMNNYHVSKE